MNSRNSPPDHHADRLFGLHRNQQPQEGSLFPSGGGGTMPPPPPMQMMLETSTRGGGGGGTEQAETPHGVVDPTFMAGTAGAAPTATANSDDMAELSKLFVLYNHDLDRVQKHLEGNLDRVQKHLEGSRNANAEVRPLVPILYRTILRSRPLVRIL